MERYEKTVVFWALAIILWHQGEIVAAAFMCVQVVSQMVIAFYEWRRDKAERQLRKLRLKLEELKAAKAQ